MTRETKYLFLAISINLVVAFLTFYVFVGFSLSEVIDFVADFFINLSVGIGAFYVTGYYIGNLLSQSKRIRIIHGIFSAFFILLIGTVAGSTVGFIQEGLPASNTNFDYSFSENITDYYFKPLFWIFFFGFIPTLILGIVVGLSLEGKSGSQKVIHLRNNEE
ncbi:hypothetical protein FXV77_21725 [Sphingobacterium phlebotomi]|uniref:Uncharacterized protein n=1 Tax=Sphingobacterium phlebotomi TaxID=2605433 RepID=A0A5D4GRY2_9SPHI|nr:hypothetical protein [Sphingobacterium phlebotomi]TYR30802.1 hypothetical protein FXV77_21725 [Sphingobacterium phlebotomi]